MKPRVLITGGSGFLGKYLALALKNDHEVFLGSRNNKQNFAAEKFTGCKAFPLDVVHIESVRDLVAEVKPDIIIHAAATKFVDLSEKQPMECTDVNVVGSQNVARVAIERKVPQVLGVSTDKAAPPVRNIYGLSKAMMERMFCGLNGKTSTQFQCVRYGNVAWSTGSVLPLWKKMHAETKVLQSTGPDMTRFFFTVNDAVALVLTGLKNFSWLNGKVLSRQMKSAAIKDILNVWVEEKGGRWEKIAGRPGDRLYECLIGDLELEYTEQKSLDGTNHYIISFNEKVKNPLSEIVSSDNAQRLTKSEISELLQLAHQES